MQQSQTATIDSRSEATLSERLQIILDNHINDAQPVSIGEIFNIVGEKSFGLLMLFLALPSALPIPAPGYSTPFGIFLACLGLQMVIGRTLPWLPQKAKNATLKAAFAKRMLKTTIWFLKKIEHLIFPRLALFSSHRSQRVTGALIVVLASIMILPIPLTNTAPAFIIFLLSIAIIEGDGLLCLAASFIGICAIASYTLAFYLFITYGLNALVLIKNTLHTYLNLF